MYIGSLQSALSQEPIMKHRAGFLCLLLALLGGCGTGPSHVAPVETRLQAASIRIPSQQMTVDGFVVQGTINGRGPFSFLMDTGAGICVVTPELSRQFPDSLEKATNSYLVSGSDRIAYDQNLAIQELLIGEAAFTDLSAVVFGLDEISAALGIQLDGILGFPLFKDVLLTLDYEHREMVISNGRLPEPNGQDILAYRENAKRPAINVEIGTESVDMVIDTGFRGYVRLPEDAIEFEEDDVWFGRSTTIAGLTLKRFAAMEQPITMGGYRLHLPPTALVGLEESTPLIGSHILKRFRLTFDQRTRRVRLTPIPLRSAATAQLQGLSR